MLAVVGPLRLETFAVAQNKLEGALPSALALEWLKLFLVAYNDLSGTIPSAVLSWIRAQRVVANNNDLTGLSHPENGLRATKRFMTRMSSLEFRGAQRCQDPRTEGSTSGEVRLILGGLGNFRAGFQRGLRKGGYSDLLASALSLHRAGLATVLLYRCDVPSVLKDDQIVRDNRLLVRCRRLRSLRHRTLIPSATASVATPCFKPARSFWGSLSSLGTSVWGYSGLSREVGSLTPSQELSSCSQRAFCAYGCVHNCFFA